MKKLISTTCSAVQAATIWKGHDLVCRQKVTGTCSQARRPDDRQFPDETNTILKDAIRHTYGSLIIGNNPFDIRNGSRFVAVAMDKGLEPLLVPKFHLLSLGMRTLNSTGC